MSADGPVEREAALIEHSWAQDELADAAQDRADGELMDIAQARLVSWAIDRVLA